MAFIIWNDSFSVNVAEIDLQHQKLVTTLNELLDEMKQGKANNILGAILNDLIHYSRTHFNTEETYFAKFGYPDAARHEEEHAAFIQKVSKFKEEFDHGKITLSVNVMHFLSDWLQNHIKGSDKEYSQFFNDNGLS